MYMYMYSVHGQPVYGVHMYIHVHVHVHVHVHCTCYAWFERAWLHTCVAYRVDVVEEHLKDWTGPEGGWVLVEVGADVGLQVSE